MRRPRRERPEYGTVPYYRRQAREYRFFFFAQLVNATAIGAISLVTSILVARAVDVFVVGFSSFSAAVNLSRWRDAREKAWNAEVEGTVQGMAASGLHSFPDTLRALADMPPPGHPADHWRASFLAEADRIEGAVDGP